MKRIYYTKREIPLHMMMIFTEATLLSAEETISGRISTKTKKFNELHEAIKPITDQMHSITKFMDYCFKNSSIPENELKLMNLMSHFIVMFIENANVPGVSDIILDAGQRAKVLVDAFEEAKK